VAAVGDSFLDERVFIFFSIFAMFDNLLLDIGIDDNAD